MTAVASPPPAAAPIAASTAPPPGAALSEAATSLLASNKAKRRALGASLESLLAAFNGNGGDGDNASAPPPPPPPSAPLLLDPRFAPLVRRARAQRAALFALSRGVPLSAGLMAAVDGVEVIRDGGDVDGGEPYFYSEPVRSFYLLFVSSFSFFVVAKSKRARCSGRSLRARR